MGGGSGSSPILRRNRATLWAAVISARSTRRAPHLGPAFPPGKYTVVVSAKGTHAGNPYDIHGDFGITLTP